MVLVYWTEIGIRLFKRLSDWANGNGNEDNNYRLFVAGNHSFWAKAVQVLHTQTVQAGLPC